MHIDQLLDLANHQHNDFSLGKDWSQGRTLFGGITTALLYQCMRRNFEGDRILRSLNTQFIAPLFPDQPFQVEIQVLRQGKNVTVAEARARQNDQICIAVTGCFGKERQSKIRVEQETPLTFRQPQKANFTPQIPGITPKFLRHVELDVIDGKLPFTGSKKSSYQGWMRYKKTPQTFTDAYLIALIDAWPPTVLQMAFGPAPASTLSWNLEFIHPHLNWEPGNWFGYSAQTRQAAEGYAHTEANIWDIHGKLVAISRQVVTIFQ